MVRNIQLKHSGKYVCMVHTAVDSVSAAADLIVRGTGRSSSSYLVFQQSFERLLNDKLKRSPTPLCIIVLFLFYLTIRPVK